MTNNNKNAKKKRNRNKYKWIPTKLKEEEFNDFFLPHLKEGTRGPEKKRNSYELFGYIMRVLSTGMKWEDIEIDSIESFIVVE